MSTRFPLCVEIFKFVGSIILLLFSAISTPSVCLGSLSGGDPLLEERWGTSAIGYAICHFEENVPGIEARLSLTQRMNGTAERVDCPPTWSIPYFSMSLPIRGSTVGFCRSCVEDFNSMSSSSSGILVSSGELWSNSVWWRHRLRGGVRLGLEAGFLNGEITEVRGSHPHLFLSTRQVGGEMVGGSVSLCRNRYETYWGMRRYSRSVRSDEFWLGLQRGYSLRGDGQMEIVYRPHPDKTLSTSQPLQFRFSARERISEAFWLTYGFATLPSPFLISFILGCSVCREVVRVSTTLQSSFSENERVVQVWIGLSTRL